MVDMNSDVVMRDDSDGRVLVLSGDRAASLVKGVWSEGIKFDSVDLYNNFALVGSKEAAVLADAAKRVLPGETRQMAKVISRKLPPDDPIFKGGPTMFTPIPRPPESPKPSFVPFKDTILGKMSPEEREKEGQELMQSMLDSLNRQRLDVQENQMAKVTYRALPADHQRFQKRQPPKSTTG